MWKEKYWCNNEGFYRDLDRENDNISTDEIGRFQIIFDFEGQRYYCFVNAINLNEALGIFFKNHDTIEYKDILEHIEI